MAYVTYETALKCKRCGHFTTSVSRFTPRALCQGCGAHIVTVDVREKDGVVTENADIVAVKVTHKLFKDIYEEV